MGRLIDEFFDTNVVKTFKTRTETPPPLKDLLTHDEVMALANAEIPYKKFQKLIQSRQKVLILFLWNTGCRISEALNLTWEHLHTNPYHVEFVQTKNGTDREVPICQKIYEELWSLPHQTQYVFSSGRQGRLDLQQINLDLKRRAEACRMAKNVHCHLFRHSYTSELKRRGVADSDLCRLLGWKDPKMLLRYDNNKLDYLVDVSAVHPMNIAALSFEDKLKKIEKEVGKWFKHHEYEINCDRPGKIRYTFNSRPA